MKRTLTYNCDTDGLTIKQFLKKSGYTSTLLTTLKKSDDGILLNEKKAYVNAVLHFGDILEINMHDSGKNELAENLNVITVYEDEDIIIFDKPFNMVTHPTRNFQSGTLANMFFYLMAKNSESGVFRPVYRLDKDTSGLVAVAKNKLVCALLSGNIAKKYICICEGELPDSGEFCGAIGFSEGSKVKRTVRDDGQYACTHFKKIAGNKTASLAEVWLETGRTHQIRVHFSCGGYPLIGDFLYGTESNLISRQALHCAHIEFVHPIKNMKMQFDSPLPDDMNELLEKIRIFV